jgi:hypothetical protein
MVERTPRLIQSLELLLPAAPALAEIGPAEEGMAMAGA